MTTILKTVAFFAGVAIFIGALMAYPIMWLWNSTCPELFHLREITAWEALRLGMLCSILFKSSTSSKD